VPPKPKGSGVDLDKILLPKKPAAPGAITENTPRVNAGILLEQEQNAVLPKSEAPKTVAPAAPVKKEEAVVKAIETYQGDIEKLIENKNVSVVSIAAAEAQRRGITPPEASPHEGTGPMVRNILMVAGGIVALTAAALSLLFVFRPAPTVQVAVEAPSPFINVDQTLTFTVPADQLEHRAAITALETQRENVSLSLGLVARFLLAESKAATTSDLAPLGTATVLKALSPNIPDTLVRALDQKNFLLGIHSFDGNQPFLILSTDSYEQAFSGMLSWETSMQGDLAPFFTRTPREHIPEEGIASTTPDPSQTFVQTGFIDKIVENHDARVIQNNTGDILLLWTFLDRNTIVVTTNEFTLREIISRFKHAPITPLP
jgi:hypothetical protein